MARAEFFFEYRLFEDGVTKRIGKGGVAVRTDDAVERYLRNAYPGRGWNRFEFTWRSTESAAFKAEERAIDDYERATGGLPPWNAIRGGSGGSSFVLCQASLTDGRACRNLAVVATAAIAACTPDRGRGGQPSSGGSSSLQVDLQPDGARDRAKGRKRRVGHAPLDLRDISLVNLGALRYLRLGQVLLEPRLGELAAKAEVFAERLELGDGLRALGTRFLLESPA